MVANFIANSDRIRSFLQGIGLSIFMASYMFSWTLGAAIGLSSFVGIGVFILFGFLIIFIASKKNKISLIFSAGRLYYLFLFIFFILFIAVFFGESKDVVWISLGLLAIILISAIDAKSEGDFCVGFSLSAFVYCVIFILNTRDAALAASSYGDTTRTSFSEENAAYTLIAYACAFCFVAALYNFIMGNGLRLFAVACMFVSALSVLLVGTRSVFGGIALGSAYAVFVGFRQAKSIRPIDVALLALLVAAAVFLLWSGYMGERISALADSVQRALETFFGGATSLEDASAAGRVYQRGYALELFENSPFFGAGFKAFWVDFPLLQAFSDLGFFFGVVYLLLFLIVPIYLCFWKIRRRTNVHILFNSLYILCVPRLFLHGQPYDWVVFTYSFLPYIAVASRSRIDVMKFRIGKIA